MQPGFPSSKQDAFDRVWKHFVTEKNPPGFNGVGCVYYGAAGQVCAVGLLVDDPKSLQEADGFATALGLRSDPRVAKLAHLCGDDDCFGFLSGLQRAHDTAANAFLRDEHDPEEAEAFDVRLSRRLRRLAEDHNLTIPAE